MKILIGAMLRVQPPCLMATACHGLNPSRLNPLFPKNQIHCQGLPDYKNTSKWPTIGSGQAMCFPHGRKWVKSFVRRIGKAVCYAANILTSPPLTTLSALETDVNRDVRR